jgi:hypothetical protein
VTAAYLEVVGEDEQVLHLEGAVRVDAVVHGRIVADLGTMLRFSKYFRQIIGLKWRFL